MVTGGVRQRQLIPGRRGVSRVQGSALSLGAGEPAGEVGQPAPAAESVGGPSEVGVAEDDVGRSDHEQVPAVEALRWILTRSCRSRAGWWGQADPKELLQR